MIRAAIQSKPKTRKCKVKSCGTRFTSYSSFVTWCSPECGSIIAMSKLEEQQAKKRREERAADRKRKEEMKTRSDYMKEAQVAFNAYIRCRDQDKLCICCAQPLGLGEVGGAFDCGHYRSVGSAPHLRFDERNAHAQRKQCNRYGAGRAVDYRIGLIARIGLAAVESLESDQSIRKWSIDELKAIKAEYKAKLKALLAARAGMGE
jgi:hypothetical protein